MEKMNRRAAVAAAGVVFTTLPHVVKGDTSRNMEDGRKDRPLTFRERRFRRLFLRAISIQKTRGKLDEKKYRRLKVAAWSGLPIATGEERGPFIRHLYREVKKHRAAKGIFDNFEWSFDGVLEWLLENWQLVLRIVLMLLVLLEEAERE